MAKIIRITLGAHACMDLPVPDDPNFNFGAFCSHMRDTRYYFNGANVYIPYDKIEVVIMTDTDDIQANPIAGVGGMTKQ